MANLCPYMVTAIKCVTGSMSATTAELFVRYSSMDDSVRCITSVVIAR